MTSATLPHLCDKQSSWRPKRRSRSAFEYVCMYKSVLFVRQRFPDLLSLNLKKPFDLKLHQQTRYRKSVPNDSVIFWACRYQYSHKVVIAQGHIDHCTLCSRRWYPAPLLGMPSYLHSLRVIQKETLSNSIYVCFMHLCTCPVTVVDGSCQPKPLGLLW